MHTERLFVAEASTHGGGIADHATCPRNTHFVFFTTPHKKGSVRFILAPYKMGRMSDIYKYRCEDTAFFQHRYC